MRDCRQNDRRVGWRSARRAALWLVLAGCDAGGPAAPAIVSVSPEPVRPGERLEIRLEGFGGEGFGGGGSGADGGPAGEADAPARAAIGGRPLPPLAAATGTVLTVLPPADLGGGEALLVVERGSRRAERGVRVAGPAGRLPEPPSAAPRPPGADAGPGPASDGGPPPLADLALPDAALEDAVGTLVADPAGPGDLVLGAAPAPAGELRVDVRLGTPAEVWGVAFHAAWDPNLLQLIDVSPAPEPLGGASGRPAVVWRSPAAGRLVFGRTTGGEAAVATLRFALVGEGEGRLDLPARFAAFRGPGNVRLSGRGAGGGSVRVRRGAP